MSDVINIGDIIKIGEIIWYDINGNPIKVITNDINVLYDKNHMAVKKRCADICKELKLINSDFHKGKDKFGKDLRCKSCKSTGSKGKDNPRQEDGTKYCTKCKDYHVVSEFQTKKSAPDGLQSYCKKIKRQQMIEWASTQDGFLTRLFDYLKNNAEKRARDIKIEITKDDVIELYKQQNGKCALTGQQLTTNVVTNENNLSPLWNISVDRIDSNGNYTKDNIQLVGAMINKMKWDFSQDDFINACKLVASYNKK